jgi:hypothetical protein
MKKIFSPIIAILIISISHAQWSYDVINDQAVYKDLGPIVTDNNDNIIITGLCGPSISFGNYTLTNAAAFVTKRQPDGSFSWAKGIYPLAIPTSGNPGPSSVYIWGSNTDATGNIYLTGWFLGKVKFDNITISSTKEGPTFWPDMFTIKISPNGVFNWVVREGLPYPCKDYGRSVDTDNSGNVYVAGQLTQSSRKGIYVVKYDGAGKKKWEKLFYNSLETALVCNAGTHAWDIISDGTDVYITGTMYGSVNFGPVTLNTGSKDTSNVFLLKLNASGTTLFATAATGVHNWSWGQGAPNGNGLFLDSNNDVYVRGIGHSANFTFGGCSLPNSNGNPPSWLAKFSSTGNCSWLNITPGLIKGEVMNPDGNISLLTYYPYKMKYCIRQLLPADGSLVDSTCGIDSDSASQTNGFSTLAGLQNGFVFSQLIKGTYQFGPLTINSSQPVNSSSWELGLIKYTGIAPPVSHNGMITKEVSSSKMILYPNPASNQITIRNEGNKMLGTLNIYDVSGKVIYRKFVGNSQIAIDVKHFPSGFYYIRSDQLQATIKFVKQ